MNQERRNLGPQPAYFREVDAAMQANGERLKVISSIWTPPSWMKQNNSPTGGKKPKKFKDGNQLRKGMEPELAEWLSTYCTIFQQEVGFPLYALSLQNEPYFSMTYSSCVYDGKQYANALKHVGQRFAKDGHDTLLFGPEHVRSVQRMQFYTKHIFKDKNSAKYLSALANHGYEDDGIQSRAPTGEQWQAMRDMARKNGKMLWMTETGIGDFNKNDGWNAHEAGFRQGTVLWSALVHGDVSLWTYWCISDKRTPRTPSPFTGNPPNNIGILLPSIVTFDQG